MGTAPLDTRRYRSPSPADCTVVFIEFTDFTLGIHYAQRSLHVISRPLVKKYRPFAYCLDKLTSRFSNLSPSLVRSEFLEPEAARDTLLAR
eukprot:m.158897 g.158897  ORF g.158897 m.158897 type:complete len:91 (+) comp14512_c0_seq2:1269-1541(+)